MIERYVIRCNECNVVTAAMERVYLARRFGQIQIMIIRTEIFSVLLLIHTYHIYI
jgi:hypothetical protein